MKMVDFQPSWDSLNSDSKGYIENVVFLGKQNFSKEKPKTNNKKKQGEAILRACEPASLRACEPASPSLEPRAASREPRAASREPRAASLFLRAPKDFHQKIQKWA